MNKLRMLIVSDQSDFDKKLTSTIKKFSSERNLFFANLYNSSMNIGSITDLNNINTGKSLSKSSGKSIFRGTLLKRCKSSKDIYDKSADLDSKKYKDERNSLQRQSFNLDQTDIHYLYSQSRRNTVKELRKNFENVPDNKQNQGTPVEYTNGLSSKPPMGNKRVAPSHKRSEFSAVDVEKRLSFREKQISDEVPASKRQLSRHSFYVQRNWYDPIDAYDDYDGRTRAKLKAEHLMNNREASKPPIKQPVAAPRNSIKNQNSENGYDHQRNDSDDEHYDDCNILKSRQNLLELHSFGRRSLNVAISRDNNLYRNILSDSFEDSKFGIKKSGSVNKIDLEILKSELDDFVDPTWRANIGLGYGFRSQRSLSSSRKELDLEQKIDLEIKMREGSAKLLAACNNTKNLSSNGINGNASTNSHNTQILEAAKNLLTSNERMTAYLAELQRRKRDRDTIVKAKPLAKVSLSEIRMPLMWRDSDHFKNKGDYRRFAVFCLVKIGTEIYDTSLLCPVDRNLTDICFNDAILFTNVTPDFELKLEVYAVMMESDLSIASTPRKIKNTIHSSISRTVGKRLAANLKDELNNTKIGPKFELIATAHLTLAEASSEAHTHDLQLTPNNGTTLPINNKLPLFGHFCCRLAISPDSYETASQTGQLLMLSKGPTRQVDGYARLQGFRLELWDDEKAFQANCQSRRCVNVTRDTKLKLKGETEIVLTNMEDGIVEEYIFRASPSEVQKWYSSIKKTIKEHLQWGHIMVSEPMQLAVPGNARNYSVRSTRQGSLYDQVPIIESIDNRQSARPTVHDIFAIPISRNTSPTMNEFRNRAYSSGRSSTHSSSTISAGSVGSISSRKSHWPFSNK